MRARSRAFFGLIQGFGGETGEEGHHQKEDRDPQLSGCTAGESCALGEERPETKTDDRSATEATAQGRLAHAEMFPSAVQLIGARIRSGLRFSSCGGFYWRELDPEFSGQAREPCRALAARGWEPRGWR